jgi:hypothetical protein
MKFDDDVMDILVHNIASDAMKRMEEAAPNTTDSERVQYLGRALSEILAAIVTAAPPDEIMKVTNNICGFLKGMVARSPQVLMGVSSSLRERLEDTVFMAAATKVKN